MRVAYLINHYPKVSHTFIRREILALEKLGHKILRFSIRGENDAHENANDRSEAEKTRYILTNHMVRLLLAPFKEFFNSPSSVMKTFVLAVKMSRRAERPLPFHIMYFFEACLLAASLRSEKVDHLHAHFGTNATEVAMLVRELGGPPWSFTVHGPEEFDKPKAIGLAEKIRRSSFVVAISSFSRSQLFRLVSHQHWPKISVVHCGLEQSFYDGTFLGETVEHRLICVGRLCEQKGHHLLLDAARQLRDEGVAFELVLAGDGEMRSQLESLISRFQLDDAVRITGWINSDQVRNEILRARALVLPSFAEGLPVVLMEAMALKRPVISTYVAGIPELVCPNVHGWLVPPGDVTALVSAMRACLIASSKTIATMGNAARERVLERHDVNREAAKLADLFSRTDIGAI